MTSLCKGATTLLAISLAAWTLLPIEANSETREEWIALGARIHGAFGPFIPVGIRVGQDALQRLGAEPRGVIVTFYNGASPPCPCIADGVMIATGASPGQGTLEMASNPAPDGALAVIVVRDKASGAALRYTIDDEWLPKIVGWRTLDPAGRYDAAMAAENMFRIDALR